MTPTYLGIDFNTHAIDLVLITEDEAQTGWQHVPLDGTTALERLRALTDVFPRASWFDENNVIITAIEKPLGRNQPGTAAALGRVAGAIITRIPQRLELWEFPPWEWRTTNGLAGNAPKGAVMARAIHAGADPEWACQDAYDAYLIARAALLINQQALT